MSFCAATRAACCAALLLTESCGQGQASPGPRLAAAEPEHAAAVHFEDLPVSRLEQSRVPQPNAANPSLGSEHAPVVIQLWSDFECPYCADMHPVLSQVLRAYAGKVRLVWRDYPLPFHAHARMAAHAGREAYAQGGASAFWKFYDAVYAAPSDELDPSRLRSIAISLGLDGERFDAAMSLRKHDAEVERDLSSGEAIGVTGTPAFLVNDYFFVGAVPLEIFRVIVDRALSDAGN